MKGQVIEHNVPSSLRQKKRAVRQTLGQHLGSALRSLMTHARIYRAGLAEARTQSIP
jgi:hypothetical protein